MTTVSIIGRGNMGKALEAVFTRAGAEVELLGRENLAEANFGEVVVLAVPYAALAGLAADLKDRLVGKTVVDITNPVDFATMQPLTVEAGSAAAELAAALPGSNVVKAFNTNFAATLASGKVGDSSIAVLAAGADEAKAVLAQLVEASGATFVDAGDLQRARELEAIGYLQISLAVREQIGWDRGFVTVK